MTARLLCRASPCGYARCYVGTFRSPFCQRCHDALTPNKRSKVMAIAGFSVLEPDSHSRAEAIVLECRKYLAREERRTA